LSFLSNYPVVYTRKGGGMDIGNFPRMHPLNDKKYALDVVRNPEKYMFELKWDGWSCLGGIEKRGGEVVLVSKEGARYGGFREIREQIANLGLDTVIFDGELVALDEQGNAWFDGVNRRGVKQYYYIFDLLEINNIEVYRLPRWERKIALQGLLAELTNANNSVLRFVEDYEGREASGLVERVMAGDLEGLVAKVKDDPYDAQLIKSTVKILKPGYSQKIRRDFRFHKKR
jgi:ATP-dependent DNA ligase